MLCECVYAGAGKVLSAYSNTLLCTFVSRSCQGHVSYLSHIFVSLCLLRQLGALYPRIFLTRHFELLADDCCQALEKMQTLTGDWLGIRDNDSK